MQTLLRWHDSTLSVNGWLMVALAIVLCAAPALGALLYRFVAWLAE